MTSPQQVNHPDHYGGADNPYEAIKVIEAWRLDFCLGNTVKYIARAGKKGAALVDLQKASWYLNYAIERLQEEPGARGQYMSDAALMLMQFHSHPNALEETTNTQALRETLHEEEHAELMFELRAAVAGRGNLAQIAREIADVLYVAYGTAWAFGINADAALEEVHRAAMDKMDAGLRREDGKILKPPGFVPPDMTEAVREAALRA